MRKLIVTCECGQRLRVPYSALGKTGVCVTCGRTIQIMAGNTRREGFSHRIEPSVLRDSQWQRRTILSEEDKQRFGKAVDLYAKEQYAEALAIFDAFLEQFPGNPEIEEARNQCLRALKRPRLNAPNDSTPRLPGDSSLTPDAVKRVVFEKMMFDTSGATQIEAARLACQILGMLSDGEQGTAKPASGDRTAPASSEEPAHDSPARGSDGDDERPPD